MGTKLPPMLKAVQDGRLTVAPQDEDGETPFPAHRGFREELRYEAGEAFDIRDKVPADFSDLSPQQAGKVRKKIEQLLGEQNPHFEYVEESGGAEADGEAE